MRLNRGTLALLVVLLLVIVGVLVVNNQQANAPGDPTATPNTTTGPLLPGVPVENIARYEIRDNTTGTFTAVTKVAGGDWVIDATNALEGRSPESSLIDTTAGQIVAINYNTTFEDDNLADFGLDQPDYTVLITTTSGELYTVYIGAKAPTAPRYYAVLAQGTSDVAATIEPGDQAIATQEIGGENANEEGVIPADSTAEVASDAAAAQSADATAEATSESNASSKPVFRQATEEATAEATADATAELTPEATADVIASPGVSLSGTQTIYTIPQTVIDTLKRWLVAPPYAPEPTPDPLALATPEVSAETTTDASSTAEAVGAQGTIQPTVVIRDDASNLIPEGTPAATLEATEAS